jgi:Flp pilus assembly protein TadG
MHSEEGTALKPRQVTTHRARRHGETGAELIEFAFISVILIALLYGIVFFGVTLGAKVTVSQAAADGSRSGIVTQSAWPAAGVLAAKQAVTDLGWLGVGTPVCGSNNGAYACTSPCSGTLSSCTTACTASSNNVCSAPCVINNSLLCPSTANSSTVGLMVVATESTCSSNANTCLTTNVTYYDRNQPLIPTAPGLALISPSNIVSNSTLEVVNTTP